MKKVLLLISIGVLKLVSTSAQSPQLNNGVQIVMTPGSYMVLDDMAITNSGTFNQTAGTVKFSGSAKRAIYGPGALQFYNLEIEKSGGEEVQLGTAINVVSQIIFTSGLLDLNGSIITLSNNAVLNGENENSRTVDFSDLVSGYIEMTVDLNAPSSVNPGNLGALISSAQNLGNTIIRRGYQSQINSNELGSSIFRYFDILPANNTTLNATLRMSYFDAELNALVENDLQLYRHNGSWIVQGFNTKDASTNFVEKTGIDAFSRWTLSTCAGQLDLTELTTFYPDADGDGYGNPAQNQQACSVPVGYVTDNTDCDDTDPAIHAPVTYYVDADGDGFGSATSAQFCQLTPPAGYANNNNDCNDANSAIYPGATETCEGIDNDCDGQIDEGCLADPTVNINDVAVYESQGQTLLTVMLSGISNKQVKINYKTIDGSAISNGRFKDYKGIGNGSITIPAGNISSTISITIYTDNITEPVEYFDVQLTKATNAVLGDNTGRVTILDGVAPLNVKAIPVNRDEIFNAKISPNPSQNDFLLQVESNVNELTVVKIFDMAGRLIKQMRVVVFESLRFGADLKQGVYIVEVKQGKNRKTMKLIKL